jgi:hypothetical protein
MTFASVSMILPLQNGHTFGRVTSSADRELCMRCMLAAFCLFGCSRMNSRHQSRLLEWGD